MLSSLAFSVLALAHPSSITAEPKPYGVVGGQLAPECGWPSTVQIATNFDEPFCTGTLVDERTVLLAAHCIAPEASPWTAGQVIFGESAFSPEVSVPIASCALHPQWDLGAPGPIDSYLWDLAVCTLAADAPDVPIVPPLMGCEADILVPGQSMVIVGFGMDNEAALSGTGIKRWTTQTIESINLAQNDLTLLGSGGSSACFGDSGGPVFVQLPDGSWRVAGVTSTAHPTTWDDPLLCGYGVVYDLIHTEMDWFEQETGRDLTPCHDADGTWNPSESCDQFPMELTPAGVDWDGLCQGGMVSGPGASCGAPFEDPIPPDTTGSDGTTGDPPAEDTSSGAVTGDSDDTTSTSTSGGMGNGESSDSDPLPGGTAAAESSSDSSSGPSGDGEDEGCGCRQSSGTGPLAAFGLVLGLAGRRRRRRA